MKNGFTVVEVMIVLAIVGILACVAIPGYQDYVNNGSYGNNNKAMMEKHVQRLYPDINNMRIICQYNPDSTVYGDTCTATGTIPITFDPAGQVTQLGTVTVAAECSYSYGCR